MDICYLKEIPIYILFHIKMQDLLVDMVGKEIISIMSQLLHKRELII